MKKKPIVITRVPTIKIIQKKKEEKKKKDNVIWFPSINRNLGESNYDSM